MKGLYYIERKMLNDLDLIEQNIDYEFLKLMNNYQILESHIIYFSAGDSKIKEILVKKDPSFSV
jgi:hypothetical protein